MAMLGADHHQGEVPIWGRLHHTGPAADLTVQPFDHVVGADARLVFAEKITVGQHFFNTVLDLLGSLLQLHHSQPGDHGFRLLACGPLEHFRYNFGFGFGHNGENIAIEMYRAALVFSIWKRLAHSLQYSHAIVADDDFHIV